MMARFLFLGFLLTLWMGTPSAGARAQEPSVSGQSTGAVQGTIRSGKGSRRIPLSSAIVTVSSGPRHITVITDSEGKYFVPELISGQWEVRAVHVGFRSMAASVQVPGQGVVTLDLSLHWEPILLPTLVVRGDPVSPMEPEGRPPPEQLGEIALRALEGSPGMVEGGLAQMVRNLPGDEPSDPQDVLFMRGSAADLKLVLLDGAPVYTPFHMAGLVDSFDPQTLGEATLFLGGAPARFDGGLSYILDLHGRPPRLDRIQGNAALDLLTSRLFLEGPVSSSTGFMVGGRALHNLGTSLLSRGSFPYGFGDFLGRLEWNGDDGDRAFITGFWNQESVLLDLPEDAESAIDSESSFAGPGILGEPPSGDKAQWGNRVLSAGYRARMGDNSFDLRFAASRYQAELPVGDSVPLFARSVSDRIRLTADFSRIMGDGSLRFGANADRIVSRYSALAMDPNHVGSTARVALDGYSGGAYLEFDHPLAASLSLRGGGRLDRFRGNPNLLFAPRVSVTWMLTDEAALTIAAGRYHQYSNVLAEDIERNLSPGEPVPPLTVYSPLGLTVGSADHLVVSLDQILTPKLRLGLEGFAKKFTGVSGTGNRALHASGVDLRVARDKERAAGWVGYTLTWFWAADGIISSGNSPFSGRHLLSAGLNTSLTRHSGLNLRASYGDGLPFTSVPVTRLQLDSPNFDEEEIPNLASDQVLNSAPDLTVGPDEGFLRLEVELFGRWSPSISGRTMSLRPYVRVLNALNRRDALFYHFDPWRDQGPEPLADLPLLPLVGLEWKF